MCLCGNYSLRAYDAKKAALSDEINACMKGLF